MLTDLVKNLIDRIEKNTLKTEVGDEDDEDEDVSFDLDHDY